MAVCLRCCRVRPNPPSTEEMINSAEVRENWSKYGEGWMVLAPWDDHERFYLCPRCAKITIDRIAEERAVIFRRM